MYANDLTPAWVASPGELIHDELEARGWTQKYLAERMNRPVQAISAIINGKKRVTAETAMQLSETFGTSAEFWVRSQGDYDLYLLRHERVGATRKAIA